MSRPPDQIVQSAIDASTLSPCRSKRGAAIFTWDRLISTGYNHKPAGFVCDGSAACKSMCSKDAVHAEQAAIIKAGRSANGAEMLHVKTVDGELVASGEPSCLQCSKLIMEANLIGMWLYQSFGWQRYTAGEFHDLSGAYRPGW